MRTSILFSFLGGPVLNSASGPVSFYYIHPQAAAEQIQFYREMWDNIVSILNRYF